MTYIYTWVYIGVRVIFFYIYLQIIFYFSKDDLAIILHLFPEIEQKINILQM